MNSKRGGSTLAGLVLMLAVASGAWASSEKVLYAFHGTDGWAPNSVAVGPDRALYGTTASGGMNCGGTGGCGVVFQLERGSGGKWSEAVLHDFDGNDGDGPLGPLVADKAGNLYGTTVYGASNGCSNMGCGVVFELVRGKGSKWTYKILYNFNSGGGLWPYAGLIFDSQGHLYGTTSHGGNFNACEGGCGVVFKVAPNGKDNWTETVLHTFSGGDGAQPDGPLVFDSSGNLYGTTEYGGAHGAGAVFKLSQRQGQWSEEILHSFGGFTGDGIYPGFGVTFDGSGNLYGATPVSSGKIENGWGIAFKLTPAKGGKWKETILRTFDRAKFGGGYVSSGLVLDKSGDLYGTANWGGKYDCPLGGGLGCGVVFKLVRRAGGKWTESVLHSFGQGGDGAFPGDGLVFGLSGSLFGITRDGGYTGGGACGQDGCGVVFEVTP